MPKIHKTLYEFLVNAPAPAKPTTKPITKPSTPVKPAPQRPSPIRRERPSTDPKPMGKKENDVYNRFISLLKKSNTKVKVNINKLKNEA